MLIELLFMADISLNLRMGYRDSASARLVMNRKQIRAHYLRTWCTVDALSSIPVECFGAVVTLAREGSFDAASTSSMGVMKVLRLTKIFRLIKLARFANDEAASWLPPSVTMLSKLGFVFLLVIHLVACLYWGVASQYFAELAMRCQRGTSECLA